MLKKNPTDNNKVNVNKPTIDSKVTSNNKVGQDNKPDRQATVKTVENFAIDMHTNGPKPNENDKIVNKKVTQTNKDNKVS